MEIIKELERIGYVADPSVQVHSNGYIETRYLKEYIGKTKCVSLFMDSSGLLAYVCFWAQGLYCILPEELGLSLYSNLVGLILSAKDDDDPRIPSLSPENWRLGINMFEHPLEYKLFLCKKYLVGIDIIMRDYDKLLGKYDFFQIHLESMDRVSYKHPSSKAMVEFSFDSLGRLLCNGQLVTDLDSFLEIMTETVIGRDPGAFEYLFDSDPRCNVHTYPELQKLLGLWFSGTVDEVKSINLDNLPEKYMTLYNEILEKAITRGEEKEEEA